VVVLGEQNPLVEHFEQSLKVHFRLPIGHVGSSGELYVLPPLAVPVALAELTGSTPTHGRSAKKSSKLSRGLENFLILFAKADHGPVERFLGSVLTQPQVGADCCKRRTLDHPLSDEGLIYVAKPAKRLVGQSPLRLALRAPLVPDVFLFAIRRWVCDIYY
jgi:hypothetical protein